MKTTILLSISCDLLAVLSEKAAKEERDLSEVIGDYICLGLEAQRKERRDK